VVIQDRQVMKNISFPFLGPFGWPKYENGLPSLINIPGVYLMTVRHQEGFLPYGVGVTRRPARNRFTEHTRSYLKGEYNILELNAAQQGIRKVLWKGWGWTPEKHADYEARRDEIITFAKHQMLGTCIFVIDMGGTPRLLERMEAAIANHFYKQDDTLFDRGMLLMPRWETEEPIIVTVRSTCKIYGLPDEIEI
jgi:hypothetical protein